MKLYEYTPDMDVYAGLYPVGPYGAWQIAREQMVSGNCLQDQWVPPSFEWSDGDPEYHGDFPPVDDGVCVFSDRAIVALSPLLGGSVEYLPIDLANGGLKVVNILNVVDCLDETMSQIYKIPDSPIALVNRYHFREGAVRGHHIFRIPQTQSIQVIVSEEFRDVVRACGLKGYNFKAPLWESV